MSEMNLVDANVIDNIISNQIMIYGKVKTKISTEKKNLSDIETAMIYWKVSDRIKEKLGVLY